MVPYQHNPAEKRRPVAIRKCAAPQITGWAALGIVIAGNRDAYIHIYTSTHVTPRESMRISSLSRARAHRFSSFIFPLRGATHGRLLCEDASFCAAAATPQPREDYVEEVKSQENFIDFIVADRD